MYKATTNEKRECVHAAVLDALWWMCLAYRSVERRCRDALRVTEGVMHVLGIVRLFVDRLMGCGCRNSGGCG